MDAHNPVQSKVIIGACYLKGLNLLKHSVYIDIYFMILYFINQNNASTTYLLSQISGGLK